MIAADFLTYRLSPERLQRGEFFPGGPLEVARHAKVGVILMGVGGPMERSEVRDFLYRFYMDPVAVRLPFRGRIRHWVSRIASARTAPRLRREYDAIGGRSPVHRLAQEQANALAQCLNGRYRDQASFFTRVSMRYAGPAPDEIYEGLRREGVNRIVLLPLHPQYSPSTTGSSFAHWTASAEQTGWNLPSTAVTEYSVEPHFLAGLNERIDQGLQRFPRADRNEVPIVFVAQAPGLIERKIECDPYCCLVHKTSHGVMALRRDNRPFRIAFQGRAPRSARFAPRLMDTLHTLADEGHMSVLLVSVAHVTDQLHSAYRLDVSVRAAAERAGLVRYEIAPALNCHPLLIEALADAVARRISVEQRPLSDPLPPQSLVCPGNSDSASRRRCSQCSFRSDSVSGLYSRDTAA